jgi:phosphoserine phosphatase RsbU/P
LQPLLMALTIVRIKENRLEVINGGMPELLIYGKETGSIKEIEPSGPPLGAFCDYDYKISKAELSPGDVILLMSDGFIERQNEKNEIFGIESCKTIFKQIADSTPQEMINRLVRESDEWANKRMQDDDITFISIKTE